MQIACPKCSMQYALDPQLLPPGGVPVQCTRCSHVFTAAPPAKATTRSTQVFGSLVPAIAPVPAVPSVPSVAPVRTPAAKPVAAKPATAKPAAASPAAPNLNATLPYGKSPLPASVATQAFGAVPQPAPVAPSGNKPQVAGTTLQAARPPAGAAPAPMTTQAFGAVPQPAPKPSTPSKTPPFGSVPPASPAAGPQAGVAPAVSATQVFSAVPQPQVPPRSQAPAAVSPSVSMAELFGDLSDFESDVDVELEGARPGPPLARGPEPLPPLSGPGPTAASPSAQPPGMLPRNAPQGPAFPPPSPSPSAPVVAVAATTPIELPEEILDQLNRPLSELMAEGSSSADNVSSEVPGPGPSAPALSKPLELPPELLDAPRANANEARNARPQKSRGRVLLLAGGVLVVALTAYFTSPAWRGKSNAVPREVLVAKDEAVVMLRRDDTTSQMDALSRLRNLSGTHPTSVELQTEMAIALAMHLDDTRVQANTLEAKLERLRDQISTLSKAQAPADWQSRVNAMREEVVATERQLVPIQERNTALSKQALELVKRLVAPTPQAAKEEAKELAQSRLRARALLSAVLGSAETPGLAVQLAQGGQQDWSTLTMAEYVLNASNTENQLAETDSALKDLREANSSFLRTYVLGARLALRREDQADAQALLDTVLTLNPKHELARQLQDHAKVMELESQEPEPEPAPESAPTP